jgi:hypothetical protein
VTITVDSLQERGPLILELLEKAKGGDAQAAARVTDILRARGHNYHAIAAFALERAGIDGHTWEGLLYEADSEGNE